MRIDTGAVVRNTECLSPSSDFAPEGWRAGKPVEIFLDFDPVCPGWPPGQADGTPPAASDAFGHGGHGAVITIDDFRRLKAVIRTARARRSLRGYPNALERKMRHSRIVFPLEVADDVVTMNSRVRVFDAATGKSAPLTVVYPLESRSAPYAISVLFPMGTAILGHRVGQTVGPGIDEGRRRFAIERILYQPEAAGDLHL